MSVVEEHPFLPYGRQSVDAADIEAVVRVLNGDFLTTGPAVKQFEDQLCELTGARFCVAVCNGTAALHAAYFAAGVTDDDEVIVPAITFLATANAARYLNAEPVFVDVDPETSLMCYDALEVALRRRPKAVAPVHMTGAPMDMARIRRMADSVGAYVIEDAAHALGASYDGVPVGACEHSHITILSFHPVKHVTTGEGGAILTNDPDLYDKLLTFRNHGMVRAPERLERPSEGPWYYEQQSLGYNYRITDLQCALGCTQLRKLSGFVERRRQLAARYDTGFGGCTKISPVRSKDRRSRSAYHLYSVLIDFEAAGIDRATLMQRLRASAIGTQVHYIPVPAQPYYQERGWRPDDFPGAQQYYAKTLSLPLFPAMDESDVDRVVATLREILRD